MPANKRTPWLICYDIAASRRIQRVYRVLCRHATPVQYSVFHTIATRHEILAMFHDIEEHINPRLDDVRAYPLMTTVRSVSLGRGRLASGIMICDSAAPDLADAATLHVRGQLGRANRNGSTGVPRHCFNAENRDMGFQPQT